MKTAIVILNWNGEKYLQQFLPILMKYSLIENVEIVVADNASTDNSMQFIKDQFPVIKTIFLEKNFGFAGGYNRALKNVNADYFVLLNSDVEVTENWLIPILDHMNSNKQVVACQPKILSYLKQNYFEHAGAAGGFVDYLGFPFCRGRILGVTEEDRGQYDTVEEVFWASGACLVVRSEQFWEVGGLDDEFFAHMEEIDLCWRFRNRGYKISCVPQSKVYHIGGGTLSVENPHKTYLNFRNNLLMLYKNLPDHLLGKILLWRFFLDYLAALQLFITGKPGNAMSVFRARADYKKMQPNFIEKRKENLLNSINNNNENVFKGSIIWEYYVKGNKKYSSIKF